MSTIRGPSVRLSHRGSNGLNAFARRDGTRWSASGTGTGQGITVDSVAALVAGADGVFVGGAFTFAGQTPAQKFVGGDFAPAGNVPATNVARRDGTNWFSLGGGITNVPGLYSPPTVAAFALDGGLLYVAGTFKQAGSAAANNLARWDGTHWTPLGVGSSGSSAPPGMAALAVRSGELLVGGRFEFAGGWPAWDLSVWHFPPRLRISRWEQGVVLSWPSATSGFVLQATETLGSPVWRPVTNAPVALGDDSSVIENPSSRAFFYRLFRERAIVVHR